MKNGGGHFAPELGGHFELESGGHFKLELGGQYDWNLHCVNSIKGFSSPALFFSYLIIDYQNVKSQKLFGRKNSLLITNHERFLNHRLIHLF